MTNSICYLQVKFNGHVQESYETMSRHAQARAKQLRAAGYRVTTSSMGPQITSVGSVKMTMLDAYGDMDNFPEVKTERL